MVASLIDTVRQRFLTSIQSIRILKEQERDGARNVGERYKQTDWCVLVVDEYSQKLLGAVLKTNDILGENVRFIESLSSHRPPRSEFDEAIYLIMPTTANVNRIINDFRVSGDGRPLYSGAHIFFIDGVSDDLLRHLFNSPAKDYLRQALDLYLNFHPIESQTFSLQDPSLFFSFFSPLKSAALAQATRARLDEDLRFTSKCILNACLAMGEYPLIRYYMPSHHGPLGALGSPPSQEARPMSTETTSRWRSAMKSQEQQNADRDQGDFLSRRLAYMVEQEFKAYQDANPSVTFPSDPGRPRGILFITDRTMDVVAPLLHEFTYQAMCNDLLPIEDGTKFRYKFQSSKGAFEDKTAILSDTDAVWTEVRHMHMREAIDKLMADFNRFLQENAVFQGEKAASLNDMKDMLASLPQYQVQREQFSLHLNMAQECMDLFEKKKLPSSANVEQNCATGLTADGKTPKTLVEEMVPLLDDSNVSNRDKVRIMALYILHREGVPEEDRRRLFQHARLSLAEQDAVNNLVYLGARVTRTPGDRDIKKKLKQKQSGAEEEYELSRYKPLIRTVLEDHFANKLDPTVFPYVQEAPLGVVSATSLRPTPSAAPSSTSLRSARPAWTKGARTVGPSQRVFVFVAGGMTYSEMRTIYQTSASSGKEIYIGSTHTITPDAFIDDMKVLALEGVGSKAAPNGLRMPHNGRGDARDYQEAYDRRYYTKDPPVHHAASVPNLSEKARPPLAPSPVVSSYSVHDQTSRLRKEKDKKEKDKKGLFHW